jgi:hypothetical protein
MTIEDPAEPAGGEAISVAAALALLPQVLDALTAAEWWRVGDEQVAEAVVALHRAETRVVAAQVEALGEGLRRGLPAAAGARGGAGWLRGLVPVTPRTASLRSELAEALPAEGLADTRSAFRAGLVPAGSAGVVVRTLAAIDQIPSPDGGPAVDAQTRHEVQLLLLDAATRIDPAQLAKAGVRVCHRLDPQAADRLARDEDAQWDAREAWLVQRPTGQWVMHAVLSSLAGAMVRAAVDPLTAPWPAADGTPDPRTPRQRTADAITTLAELTLAARAGEPGALPRRTGSPTRVLLTGDVRTLLADVTSAGGALGVAPAVVETGDPGGCDVSPLTLQTMACDAELLAMLLDSDTGRPLDVGETSYPFPPKVRRAIEARDRHCTFTGCTAPPSWCDAHHLVAFARSRWTAEANGTLLCGRHHRFVHAHGWVGRLVDGHVVWRPRGEGDRPVNAQAAEFEQQLRHLALRWLARTRAGPPDES